MAANSHTSSMSAQNGSSYSSSIYPSDSASQTAYQGSSYPSAASAAQARYPGGPRPARTHRNYQLENGHEPSSQPQASGGGEHPIYEQPTSADNTHQDYYLSSPGYYPPAEPPTYENELDFDEDQNEASQSTSMYGQSSYPNNSGAYIQPTSVPQNYSTQQVASTGSTYLPSETTQMWSAQQSPEERLRLGLPRHEPGQQTHEYQQAASRYESAHRSRR